MRLQEVFYALGSDVFVLVDFKWYDFMWQTHIQKLMLHLKDRFFTIFHRFLHRIDFGICLNSFETIFLRNFLSILLILVCVITSPEPSHPSRIPSSHQNKLFYLVFILRIFVSSIRCTELYRFLCTIAIYFLVYHCSLQWKRCHRIFRDVVVQLLGDLDFLLLTSSTPCICMCRIVRRELEEKLSGKLLLQLHFNILLLFVTTHCQLMCRVVLHYTMMLIQKVLLRNTHCRYIALWMMLYDI